MSKRQQNITTSYTKWKAKCLAFLEGPAFQLQKQEAEDVYHQLWAWILTTDKDIPDLQEAKNQPWLFQKLKWFGLNHQRGKERYRTLILAWLNTTPVYSSTEASKKVELGFDLAMAFELFIQVQKKIGAECQQLLLAFYQEDLPVKDLAERFQWAVQTVKNKLQTCRAQLKVILSNI